MIKQFKKKLFQDLYNKSNKNFVDNIVMIAKKNIIKILYKK